MDKMSDFEKKQILTSIFDTSHKDSEGRQFRSVPRTQAVFEDYKVVGYVKGTQHEKVNYELLEKYDDSHLKFIIPRVNKVFFEVVLPDMYSDIRNNSKLKSSIDKSGTEKFIVNRVHSSIEENVYPPRFFDLETRGGHENYNTITSAMLTSTVLLFDNGYQLPWSKYVYQYPKAVLGANILSWIPLGLLGAAVTIPLTVSAKLVNKVVYNSDKPSRIYKHFKLNTTLAPYSNMTPNWMFEYALVTLRDKDMYKNLKNNTDNLNEKFLVAIGAAHLSNTKGILSHLENDGYVLRDLDVVMNKEKVVDEIHERKVMELTKDSSVLTFEAKNKR